MDHVLTYFDCIISIISSLKLNESKSFYISCILEPRDAEIWKINFCWIMMWNLSQGSYNMDMCKWTLFSSYKQDTLGKWEHAQVQKITQKALYHIAFLCNYSYASFLIKHVQLCIAAMKPVALNWMSDVWFNCDSVSPCNWQV